MRPLNPDEVPPLPTLPLRFLPAGDDIGEQLPPTARRSLERLLMRVEPRQAQQIGHEPFHAGGVAQNDLEKLLGSRLVGWIVEDRFDVAADGGKRCS